VRSCRLSAIDAHGFDAYDAIVCPRSKQMMNRTVCAQSKMNAVPTITANLKRESKLLLLSSFYLAESVRQGHILPSNRY
jgi:hypothetical protein